MLLGPQWPPFALVPESYTTAAARELADFAVMYGQPPDEWQANTLEIGCGERQDGTWAAQEVAVLTQRQNGKGGVFEPRGLGGLFLLGERRIIYTAHNIDTAKMAFGRCVDLVDGCDDLRRRVKRVNKTNSEEAIELLDGAELQFRTRGRVAGKGRGFSCDCLFLDEALYLRQEALDALMPTMLARPNPQIWYLSTPPEDGEAALMTIRDDGLAGVPNMAMALWCNEPGADLTDERVLAYANPAWGIRLNQQVMEVLRRRLGDEGFARECGGIWPRRGVAEWLVIPEAAWEAAEARGSQLVGRPAYGVYVPPDRSCAAIATSGVSSVGGRHIEVTGDADQVLDYRPGTRWVVGRLQELERHRPTVLVVDDKALADEAEAAGLTVHRASVGDVVTGCQLLFDGIAGADVAARDVHHIGQPELTDAAAGAVKRDVGGSWAWARRDLSVEVAPIAAGSLALFGHCTPRVWRRDRTPAAAFVDVAARPQARPSRRLAAAVVEDVAAARLREQIERDLAVRSRR